LTLIVPSGFTVMTMAVLCVPVASVAVTVRLPAVTVIVLPGGTAVVSLIFARPPASSVPVPTTTPPMLIVTGVDARPCVRRTLSSVCVPLNVRPTDCALCDTGATGFGTAPPGDVPPPPPQAASSAAASTAADEDAAILIGCRSPDR